MTDRITRLSIARALAVLLAASLLAGCGGDTGMTKDKKMSFDKDKAKAGARDVVIADPAASRTSTEAPAPPRTATPGEKGEKRDDGRPIADESKALDKSDKTPGRRKDKEGGQGQARTAPHRPQPQARDRQGEGKAQAAPGLAPRRDPADLRPRLRRRRQLARARQPARQRHRRGAARPHPGRSRLPQPARPARWKAPSSIRCPPAPARRTTPCSSAPPATPRPPAASSRRRTPGKQPLLPELHAAGAARPAGRHRRLGQAAGGPRRRRRRRRSRPTRRSSAAGSTRPCWSTPPATPSAAASSPSRRRATTASSSPTRRRCPSSAGKLLYRFGLPDVQAATRCASRCRPTRARARTPTFAAEGGAARRTATTASSSAHTWSDTTPEGRGRCSR